ncbi:MAG: DUF3857 domain-containing protein [Planctomycetes bacterium]|nr:DUF3857 domain-containing protein [Planctomycetota bacterium]
MRRIVAFTVLLTAFYFVGSCASTPSSSPERAPAVEHTPPLPAADDIVPTPWSPRLTLRAFALESRGQTRAARTLIASELLGRAQGLVAGTQVTNGKPLADTAGASAGPLDELDGVDLYLAVLQWRHLVELRDRWRDTAEVLERIAPSIHWPADVSAALATLQAECLRNLGRCDEAFALSRSLGYVTDWRVVGPFDNERGKGFSAKNPPETSIDFGARYKGKAREVAWRDNPVPDDPLGRLHLDEMLRPSQQGLAYLTTAVRSTAELECVLNLSSNGSLKVFVNGLEVLARKLHRPFADDQDRVVIALQPGWNRIVIKSCIEDEHQWQVAARFTALDGSPLILETNSAREIDQPLVGRKAQSALPRGARQILDDRAQGDPDAARLLTLYHMLVHPDDKAQPSARKAITKALAQDGDDIDTLYLQAMANAPDSSTSRAEMEVNSWITPLKAVVARDATHVAARLDLARFSLDLNPILARADALTREALAAAPDDPDVLELRAYVLHDLERPAEADPLDARRLRSSEFAWTDAGTRERADALHLRGNPADAIATLQRGFSIRRTHGDTYGHLCDLLVERNDVRELVRVAEAAVRADPSSVALLYNAARGCEKAKDFSHARDFLERALRIAPEDTDVLLSLARLDQRAGDMQTSDARLAEIVRIDPGRDKIRRQREYLADEREERFEAPYTWDARELAARITASSDQNEPLAVLDRTCVWAVNRDGTSSSYEHILWRVQNPGGAKSLDHYVLFRAPGATLSVVNMRILRADGRVEPAPAPRRADEFTSRGFARVYDLPPLAVGDLVDVEYRVDESVPSVFGNYFGLRHEFYPDYPDSLAPTLRSELVLVTDPDVQLYLDTHQPERIEESTTTDSKGRTVRRYVTLDLPRPRPEPQMPARSEFAPHVDVTTYENWQAFATWWWNFIEKEFVTSPEMKAKVQELTADKASEIEKIRALVRFAGQEIRYNSWPFGTHGYEPFSAPVIFERRFGDCKDKSILLCQMLSEIGVAAHPVLIKAEYARSIEPLEVALVEHFNHCIAYAPATADRPGLYLDCTADLNPIDYLRADDQGAHVLHVDDGKAELAYIPYAPPQENQFTRRYDVTLDETGDGSVRLVDESNGAFGVGLRTQYGGETGDIQKRLAGALRGAFSEVVVREVHTSDLEDIGVPARLESHFSARKLWARETGGASLRMSFDPLGLEGIAVLSREERTRDLVLDRPFAHDITISYRIPSTMRVTDLPPRVEVTAPGLLSYSQEVRQDEDMITIQRRFELVQRRIPAAQYGDFQDAMRRIEQAEQRTVRLQTRTTDKGGR